MTGCGAIHRNQAVHRAGLGPTTYPGPTTSQPAGQGRSTAPWVLGGATACVVLALVTAGLVMAAAGTDQSSSSRHAVS